MTFLSLSVQLGDQARFVRLKEKVFSYMNNEIVSRTAVDDKLIRKFGARYLKTRTDAHKNEISANLRDLAKLKVS